jgi:hypothetical protein
VNNIPQFYLIRPNHREVIYLKKTIFIFTILIIAAASASCAENKSDIAFDTVQLAEKLSKELMFDDELIRLSDDVVSFKYNFGGGSTIVYAGSGATPEIIIITECSEPDAAEKAAAEIKGYIKDQIDLFSDYNASQLPKLETAFCRTYGNYAICVIAKDSAAAQDIIENAAVYG